MQPRRRRSIRLRGWDYASRGAYFVTIVTRDRVCWFDRPRFRAIVEQEWRKLPRRFPTVRLDEFVVMPNHVHFIIWLNPPPSAPVGAQLNCAPTGADGGTGGPTGVVNGANTGDGSPIGRPFTIDPERPTLGWVVRTFKAAITRRIRLAGGDGFAWQRNYYERIIRDERALRAIRRYIRRNPACWTDDREFAR